MDLDAEVARMNAAIDAAVGKAAVFNPDGESAACLVEQFLPEPEIGFGEAKGVAGDFVFKITRSLLPRRPKRDDVFVIGDDSFRVVALATIDDDDGARYSVKVETVA